MQIVLEVEGAEAISIELLRWGRRLDDLSPAYDEITRYFWDLMEEQFASEGARGPDGAWAPLSDDYARWKELNFPGQPILQRTGDLIDSLTGEAPGAIHDETSDGLELGTEIFYGKFHQSKRPRTRLPRRPMIDLTQTDRRVMAKILQTYIVTGELRGMGL